MGASLIDYDWELDGSVGVTGNDADDKVVVDPALLEEAAASGARAAASQPEEPRAFARGTRDHVQCPHSPPPILARGPAPRPLERDPIAVLRTWPHSTVPHDAPIEGARPALPSSRGQRRVRGKMALAHFALDLYSELDDLQAIVQRVDDASEGDADREPCTDPCCAAKLDVMRGALLEACLLVQRVAMTPPGEAVDIEDRIHELLELARR